MGTLNRHLIRIESDSLMKPVEGRLIVVDVQDIAQEAIDRHHLDAASGQILTELILAGALLIPMIKNDEGQTINLAVSGKLRSAVVDTTARGGIRAYVGAPDAVGVGADQGARVSDLLGSRGTFNLLRFNGGKVLYRGSSPMSRTGVSPSLAMYLNQSEQVQSSLVFWGDVATVEGEGGKPGTLVRAARAILLQAMGGGDAQGFANLIRSLDPGLILGSLQKRTLEDLPQAVAPGAVIEDMGASSLFFECSCDIDRMAAALMTLGSRDLEALMIELGEARVTCHFCGTEHVFDIPGILKLIARIDSQGEKSMVEEPMN